MRYPEENVSLFGKTESTSRHETEEDIDDEARLPLPR